MAESGNDHPFLVPYVTILVWCACVVLIGVGVRQFEPSFSLTKWIFADFPNSALHPITWAKEAGVLFGAFLITLLLMRFVFGIKPFRH